MAVFIWDNQDSGEFSDGLKQSGIQARSVASEEELLEKMAPGNLVIMNQPLEARKTAVRELITQRIAFAVYGLPGPDEDARAQLARRLKKRHVPACWLGSLRFLPGIFRLKELVNSGVFGNLQSVRISGADAEQSPFEFFRRGDLLNWMLAGTEMRPEAVWSPGKPGDWNLQIRGTTGEANWHCTPQDGAELAWRMGNKEKVLHFSYENPLIPESRLLYTLFLNERPWLGVARIQ